MLSDHQLHFIDHETQRVPDTASVMVYLLYGGEGQLLLCPKELGGTDTTLL